MKPVSPFTPDSYRKLIDPLYEPFEMPLECIETYKKLLSTFEMRKASWQLQSGLLFEIYPGCTHTRRAHAIGCWILGWRSLDSVKVLDVCRGGTELSLSEWLVEKGKVSYLDYLLSLLLHDIGHPPFSHALENTPFFRLDHEEITRSLIRGEPEGKVNWWATLEHLLTTYRLEGRSVIDANTYKAGYAEVKREILTVHKVLQDLAHQGENVNYQNVYRILKGDDDDYVIHALHQLVDSEVDIDRIDHFLRDSYYSGVRLADYRAGALLMNLVLICRGTDEHAAVFEKNPELHLPDKRHQPLPVYIAIKRDGLEYVQHLLTAREFIYGKILFHPKNLFLIGALNMAVSAAVKYDPVLESMIPFMSDQALLQVLREKRFARSTIGGYERILRGERTVDRFETVVDKSFTSISATDMEELRGAYSRIERHNCLSPADAKIILFSNMSLKPRKDWFKAVISEVDLKPLKESSREGKLFEWLEHRESSRRNRIIVWTTETRQDVQAVLGDEIAKHWGIRVR